jgi:hypothetical protein
MATLTNTVESEVKERGLDLEKVLEE